MNLLEKNPPLVLIVDDSSSVRHLLRRSLEEAGHEVIEACDGLSALAVLAKRRPQLVLTDVNMGEMDGLTLVRRIRERFGRSELPVLVLTTEASDEMKARGRDAGATGWLVKPFQPGRMITVIRHVLGATHAPVTPEPA